MLYGKIQLLYLTLRHNFNKESKNRWQKQSFLLELNRKLITWFKTRNHISLMHIVPKSTFFVLEPNYGGKHYLNSPFNIANSFCRCQVLSPLTITLD